MSHVGDFTFSCEAPIALPYLHMDRSAVRNHDPPCRCVQVGVPTYKKQVCDTDPQSSQPGAKPIWFAGPPGDSRTVSEPRQFCLQLERAQTCSSCGDISDFFTRLILLGGRSARSMSVIVGLRTDGPWCPCTVCSHASSAAQAACCGWRFVVALALPSSVFKKPAEASSTNTSRRARSGGATTSPALVVSRIMSHIHGRAAITTPRCASRTTSTDLLHPLPDWPTVNVACSALSSVNLG